MTERTMLFYAHQMEPLARAIVDVDPRIQLGDITWQRFPDQFPDIRIAATHAVRDTDVAFLASFEQPDWIFEQWSAILALMGMGARRMLIVLPYFPTATMERRDKSGQVVTAKTMARLLSYTAMSVVGAQVDVVFYDIHQKQVEMYFDFVHTRSKRASPYLLPAIRRLIPEPVIAFPDLGARKRFEPEMPTDIPIVTLDKKRIGDKRELHLVDGREHVDGRNVVVYDDIIASGGTTIGCAQLLRQHGAATVSACATHGVFPQDAWQRFMDDLFTHVIVSNSCFATAQRLPKDSKITVVSLADSMSRVVMRSDRNS